MASLKDIRRRISSVKSTQKITKAMKLVAAAKLRRAQDAVTRARPYAEKLTTMVCRLVVQADRNDHSLLRDEQQGARTVLVVVVTSDRGLCGAFNAGLLRQLESYLATNASQFERCDLCILGRKGRDYLQYRSIDIETALPGADATNAREHAASIGERVVRDFADGTYDEVIVLYNEFKSAMSQRVVQRQLLPVTADEIETQSQHDAHIDFEYEPTKGALLTSLLPKYVETVLHQAVLESIASEYGARMTAMENATNNASEMISSLTLEYNKARQAAITTELLEIVAGAEALRTARA